MMPSGGKKLRRIGEAFEFESVAARVSNEECSLFANLTCKANSWRNQKFATGFFKSCCERLPVRHIENNAKMACRYRVTIHRVCWSICIDSINKVQSNLVSVKFRSTQRDAVRPLAKPKSPQSKASAEWRSVTGSARWKGRRGSVISFHSASRQV